MEVKHRVSGNMLSIFGMILFISGIAGMGCAVWMFFSNNGGLLYWLSILIGLVCIPVTALGYFLIGEKERQEQAKGDKKSKNRSSQAVKNDFVHTLAAVFGTILLGSSVVTLAYAIVIAAFGGGGPVDPAMVAFPLAALSILGGVAGALLLLWTFRGKKRIRKRISKG